MTDREKIIYDILCSDEQPPEGQHWEGFVAKKIAAALAQPEQEPVAWWHDMGDVVDLNVSGRGTPLYFAPPQREWHVLTEDDALQLLPVMPYEYEVDVEMILEFASAIEAKLKEKNGTI